MTPGRQSDQAITLDFVLQQFAHWRVTRSKKSPIPEDLWETAAALAGQYSIHRIAKALNLNHSALRDRIVGREEEKAMEPARQPCFLELPTVQPSPVSESHIEMENRHGEKMRLHFSGQFNLDLLTLSRDFWAR